ncbi:MAG TPA: AraC family transcriptional regulator [Steroidobacteraceae bacterium]|nr:AraC family transcriptional regulator [Steroidobacteraceae bacterium]
MADEPAFAASTVADLVSCVESYLGAVCMEAPTERRVNVLANRHRLPGGELWFCSYGEPVQIRFAETDYLRVQFPRSGRGTTLLGHHRIDVVGHQGCMSAADATLSFGRHFKQLVWRVDRSALSRKFAAITGHAPPRQLEFDPRLDLTLPAARPLLGILHDLVHCVSGPAPHRFVETELEQALMVTLLTHAGHNARHLFERDTAIAAPWQVLRVEEYIAANLHKPFMIEEVAALTGCSARTLYRTFRKYRGYSPAEFSKQRRLCRARDLLREGPPFRAVGEVAAMCGFADLSHFSRDFRTLWGQWPSASRQPPK